MYLLAQRIKASGIKVVLSGEGADEIFGGYLYFHKAPSPVEYHKECVRLVRRLHQWDVMRANKAPFAFGVETRVPFLDKNFLQARHGSLSIRPQCSSTVGREGSSRPASRGSWGGDVHGGRQWLPPVP
jgi:asparagine synthase (glutamine-hydrolysing)